MYEKTIAIYRTDVVASTVLSHFNIAPTPVPVLRCPLTPTAGRVRDLRLLRPGGSVGAFRRRNKRTP